MFILKLVKIGLEGMGLEPQSTIAVANGFHHIFQRTKDELKSATEEYEFISQLDVIAEEVGFDIAVEALTGAVILVDPTGVSQTIYVVKYGKTIFDLVVDKDISVIWGES